MGIEDAVKKSVDDCIKNNVLQGFLETHRKEVVDMCLTEFDETKWGELLKEEGHQKGIISLVKKGKISVEDAAEELGLDVPATEKLLAENGIQVPSVV